jgi:uncharacterized Zn ribbon protein
MSKEQKDLLEEDPEKISDGSESGDDEAAGLDEALVREMLQMRLAEGEKAKEKKTKVHVISHTNNQIHDTSNLQVLDNLSFAGIANYIKSGKAKNIITLAGAGISTSAGIPDFR